MPAISEWLDLDPDTQLKECQNLNPYEEWELFKAVEAEFVRTHGRQARVLAVFCGIAGTVGPLNAITVHIGPGRTRVRLPDTFLGFPVLRERSVTRRHKPRTNSPLHPTRRRKLARP